MKPVQRAVYIILIIVMLVIMTPFNNTASASTQAVSTQADELIKIALYEKGKTDRTRYGSPATQNWCAYFVSWCARQAGIPKAIIPNLTTASGFWYARNATLHYFFTPWLQTQKNSGIEKGIYCSSRSQYEPKVGDMVFFRWKGEANKITFSHIEIVYKVDSKNIYTVGGNKSGAKDTDPNRVWTSTYSKTSSNIVAYGTPNYSDVDTKNSCKETNNHLTYSSSGYCTYCNAEFNISLTMKNQTLYAKTDNIPVRARPYATETVVMRLAKNTIVTVTASGKNSVGNLWYLLSDGNWLYSENLTATKPSSIINYPGSDNTTPLTTLGKVTIDYNANGGTGAPASHDANKNSDGVAIYTLSPTVPTKNGYLFIGWVLDGNMLNGCISPNEATSYNTGNAKTNNVLTYYALWEEIMKVETAEISFPLLRYDVHPSYEGAIGKSKPYYSYTAIIDVSVKSNQPIDEFGICIYTINKEQLISVKSQKTVAQYGTDTFALFNYSYKKDSNGPKENETFYWPLIRLEAGQTYYWSAYAISGSQKVESQMESFGVPVL